ncbi:MAG: hypothetical protein QM722_00660 [Piscinibacter sp.]
MQRYALNVVSALDKALGEAGAAIPLVAPKDTPDPGFAALPLTGIGPLAGHAWEQLVLPARWPGRLLNLCNTGPAAKADQIVCIHDANVFTAPESYGRAFRTAYRTLPAAHRPPCGAYHHGVAGLGPADRPPSRHRCR